MGSWLKKVTIPFVAIVLPFFVSEMFFAFLFFRLVNNISEAPLLLQITPNFK